MKRRKIKKIIISAVSLVIVLVGGIFIGRSSISSAQEKMMASFNNESTNQVVSVEVGTETLEKTLTSSGQITSSGSEKISLDTEKSFEIMCVEQDDLVSKGDNILQYTDGTYLTAEYDCVISNYSVPEAEAAVASSNYVEVQNIEKVSMTLDIDESEINTVAVGQEVEIQLTADEEKTYTGTITKINATGTYASTGTTFTAVLTFDNDGEVKIGMSASCKVILEKAENTLVVPIAAVQTKSDMKYVVVVDDSGSTKNVEVETGISNDSYVEIKNGLTGSEKVQMVEITSGRGGFSGGDENFKGGAGGNMGEPPSGDMQNFKGRGNGNNQ